MSHIPYRNRVIESKLQEYVDYFSIVGVTGPRQSGKSTLLLHCLPNYRYVSFDDFKMVQFFEEDPEGFMRIYQDRVIFDEVQKVPRLFEYIKMSVDKDRANPGKFVLTGSSQLQFMQKVTESLAGRIGLLSLLPYQIAELPEACLTESLYKGSYPELVEKEYHLFQDWYAAYLDTYLSKDVSTLAHVGDRREFRRLLRLLAAQTAQTLNASTYARDLGVDVKTIQRWISILEASYILFLLPPYFNNFGKRIVKSPKIYFYDTGLVSYLTGIETHRQFAQGPMAGSLFENYVIADLYKDALHRKTHTELYYLRTHSGVEIDLIIDHKSFREFIEIKLSATFNHHWLKPMESFLTDPKDQGVLLYTGQDLAYTPSIQVQHYLSRTRTP